MPSIHTALSVNAVAPIPSTSTLQWTADGQACFLTKTSLYIMTPDHGLNFDLAQPIKSKPRPLKAKNASQPEPDVEPIGWYRTLVQFDRPLEYLWPEQSQSWNAIVLGTVDIALWAATASPSGLSTNASCIVAALTSSMDFTLWTASRNGLNGEWVKIFDVTPFLLEHFGQESNAVRAIRSQVTSIHWSQQADFGIRPAALDGSLLVAGTRAGMLLLLRYRAPGLELLKALSVSDQWIVRVAVSPWRISQLGKCQATVAFTTDDGAVSLVNIEQTLEDAPSASMFGFPYTIRLSILDDTVEEIFSKDSRPARGLLWIELPKAELVLVFAKSGSVGLCRPSASGPWTGTRQFTLRQTPKLSAGTSCFSPTTGLVYLPHKDVLLISLADGSVHALHKISEEPSWDAPTEALSSDSLSRFVRATFVRTEPPRTADEEPSVQRVSGMASYDDGASVISLHEAVYPADFSYLHDARHNNLFIVSRLWETTEEDDGVAATVQNLSDLLNSAQAAAGFTPAHLLRPTFLALHPPRLQAEDDHGLHEQLLAVLAEIREDDTTSIMIHPWTGGLTTEMRREFRGSLTRHLFGWNGLLRLRLSLGVADFLWKSSDTEERRTSSGIVASSLVFSLSHGFVRTIIRHLIAAATCLQQSDMPFVLRMVMHTLLADQSVPEDLKEEGQILAHKMTEIIPGTLAEVANGLNESCPACRVNIPFTEVTSAVCERGHHWGRCSITTFILSSPSVRTCVGCGRKAFLPPSTNEAGSSSLPPSAQGWVVEELLEAVKRCLFCGNSFINVL
uniref:Transcription factor IIIC 90kDa subunit N-terminal domain-containing protein n=1 Tax=Mycena chlorophos TaxID=658473 RepID=A0ABQ0L5P6_MYCCL|nr:predicted protein [Mycena chlorophos]